MRSGSSGRPASQRSDRKIGSRSRCWSGGTVVPLCQSPGMTSTVITRDDAERVAEMIASGLDQLIDAEFWRFPGDDLLGTARTIERLARRMYAAQVAVAGEIDLA